MELRELIKSTVAEFDEIVQKEAKELDKKRVSNDEKEFLEFIKSRTEVLFLGLKTKDIKNIEDKLDITLKYLEFLLATVEKRLESIS
jgi:hypothetical protein